MTYIKDIKDKDSKEAKKILTNLGKEAEKYKLLALARAELESAVGQAFISIKKFLGDKYVAYVLEAKKPNELFDIETDDGKKNRKNLIALQNDFYFKSMKCTEVSLDMIKIHNIIKALRQEREVFAKKMFKKYKLDNKKSFKFGFEENKIYQVEPDIPEGVKAKNSN